jgi:hypothetical protein
VIHFANNKAIERLQRQQNNKWEDVETKKGKNLLLVILGIFHFLKESKAGFYSSRKICSPSMFGH